MAGEAPFEHDSSWPVVSLGEIAIKIGSGATPKGGADAYIPNRERYALVRSQNVFDRRFDHNGLAFITGEQANGLRSVVLQPTDILLNITGDGITFGRACVVPDGVLPACVNQHVSIIRVDARHADPGYVLGFLTHPAVKLYIESFNAGGSRRAVTKGHIESFRLPLPPLLEQRAIAHILGTLDDKIELNRRMNETLEAMARTLFKSWFVDFDPVRSKAEGRNTGLPKHIADLFPDSFEDSALGEIPKGWAVGTVGDLCDAIYSGGTPSTQVAEYWNGEVPWLSSGETRKTFIIDTEKRITEAGISNSSTRLARALSTVIASAGQGNTRGQTSLLGIDSYVNQSVVVLIANFQKSSPLHLFFDLERRYDEFRRLSDGHSSRGSLTTKLLAGLGVVLPPLRLIERFESIVAPAVTRAIWNLRGSNALTALRDALLPKLISGELRVKGAKDLIQEITV